MRRLSSIRRRSLASLPFALMACVIAMWFGAAGAGAATAPWSPVTLPWGASWSVYDVYAFGATSLAATGEEGHIAVTRNGGGTWKVVVPGGFGATAFTAIALGPDGHGAVASGGLLLVTDDVGSTWTRARFLGPGLGAAITDIAVRGPLLVAVGEDGTIVSSDDSGATWRRSDSPTESALTSVAIAGDGTAIAGSVAGEILVDDGGGWRVAGLGPGPVTSVAAAADPVWGAGPPDLVAACGSDILGSDDALAFVTLPGLPGAGSQPWSRVAWTGVPQSSLLIAGAQKAGFFDASSLAWVPGTSGLGAPAGAVAPAGQSVAYLLGVDGRLVRTFSAGREPAAVALSRSRIVAGTTTSLTATVRVGAPGQVLLRSRVPGRSWVTQRRFPWTAADWNRGLTVPFSPLLNQEYALTFEYGNGGAVVPLSEAVKVVVAPRVGTSRSRYDLRVGSVYRFSGTVTPKLSGERIELFTDRGGSWRPVSRQPSVEVRDGGTWTSRAFGTPKAETYRLRAHIKATAKHGEAWSGIVTVSIRR